VESDKRGRFELRIPEGTYYVSADKDGYGPAFVPAHSGDNVSLALPASGVVEGRVYNERREPVRHFTIDVITMMPDDMAAPAPLWSKTFDSPDGSFRVARLPAWRSILRATAPGYAPTFSPLVRVEPSKTRAIDLTLTSGCTLEGRVQDRTGAPLPHVFVDAEARTGAGSVAESSLDAAAQGESDNQGHFRLEHVPAGPVLVRGYDGSNAVSTTSIEVSDCDRLEPVKLVMSAGGSLSGVVRGSDGEPVAGAQVTVTHRSIGFVNTQSDAEGRFRLDQLPPSTVRVEVQHLGRRTRVFVAVKDAELVERDIALFGEGKSEIRGRITAGGKPLHGVQVMVVSNHGPDQGADTFNRSTGEDGSYRFSAIPEGMYMIRIVSTMLTSAARVEAGQTVTVDLDMANQPVIVSSN
jgi:hypothetical protein